MSASIIDGKAYAAGLGERIAASVSALAEKAGNPPGLAVVLVGNDPASGVYVRSKGKTARRVGMVSFEHVLPEEATQDELMKLIAELNADDAVDGILVLPLPTHLDSLTVVAAIDPERTSTGCIRSTRAARLRPAGPRICTPLGCLMLLRSVRGNLSGLDAIVVGRSILVGKPVAQLLLWRTARLPSPIPAPATWRRRSPRPTSSSPRSAGDDKGRLDQAGGHCDRRRHQPGGAGGKTALVGDVEFGVASRNAGAITPVPGGVGPMTIMSLIHNTLVAAYMRGACRAAAMVSRMARNRAIGSSRASATRAKAMRRAFRPSSQERGGGRMSAFPDKAQVVIVGTRHRRRVDRASSDRARLGRSSASTSRASRPTSARRRTPRTSATRRATTS